MRTMMPIRHTPLLLVVTAAPAMHDQSAVRDSADIRIVTSSAPLWTKESSWRLSRDPEYVVGVAAGPDYALFNGVVGVVRQSSGVVVVADMGSAELRFFRGPHHIRTVGRRGRGPGEFQQLFKLQAGLGDSLFAYDVLQGFHLFDPNGRYVRTIGNGRRTQEPVVAGLGWFGDGSQLAALAPNVAPERSVGGGVDSATLYRIEPTGTIRTVLWRYPLLEFATGPQGKRARLVFGGAMRSAVWVDRFCVGFSRRFEFLCADSLGRPGLLYRPSALGGG
jgi:hypothetical protein